MIVLSVLRYFVRFVVGFALNSRWKWSLSVSMLSTSICCCSLILFTCSFRRLIISGSTNVFLRYFVHCT